ncbi:MAG: hypothetical protein QGH20_11550, partial [Candidatus Latescibacteria bacterium]|nr:hypothetical protein [Candidatus Latescibacterota bacterium]
MPDEIVYLDSYAYIGQRGPIDPEARWSTDSLIDEMSHVGIHGALVTHSIAKEYDPAYGNDLLTDELAKNPRLLGCWVLLPHHFGEMVPGGQLVEQMLDNGIRAARLCPNTHHYTLDKSTSGEILSALEAQTIPLCIEGSAADYGTLGWLCEAYPKLPV